MLVRTLTRNLFAVALVCLAVWLIPSTPHDPEAQRLQSGNVVLYDHRDECWTGVEPAKVKVPGHVIMRVEGGVGGSGWFYGGKHWVDIALNDVFTKDNPRVHVVAFCK